MVILQLVKNSLARRKAKALISMIGLALSIGFLLVLTHVKNSIHHTIERVTHQSHLIIGAPSQPAHLALYGLFQIGSPPPAITLQTYLTMNKHPEVASAIPLSMMESHKGVTVIGTNNDLFLEFDHQEFLKQEPLKQKPLKQKPLKQEPLKFSKGKPFGDNASVVLGAQFAQESGYNIGEKMTIAKGAEPTLEDEYSTPLTISGILAPTGTVLDSSILVDIDELMPLRSQHSSSALQTKAINLVLIRLHNRQALLPLQQQIQHLVSEPVEVVIPSQELGFIQHINKQFATLMLLILIMTIIMALVGTFFSVSGNLAERRNEIDTLRMLGARSYQVAVIGLLEPLLIIVSGTISGFIVYQGIISGLTLFLPWNWQIWTSRHPASFEEIKLLFLILLIGSLLTAIPAWKTYGQCNSPK